MKIGYQGAMGSFSQLAAQKLFPNEELINHLTFDEVIKEVLADHLDYGILPIENSFTGEVGMVLDELFAAEIYINKVYELPIVQNLVGLKDASLDDIKQVYSHEQALMQCSEFLKAHNFEMISFPNTALASKYVSDIKDKSKAAIASDVTAELYDLKIIQEAINNKKSNTTRFAVVGKSLETIKDHFAFIFTVKDGSGALANILSEISLEEINLTSIKSRSMHDLPWKYYFYCEAEGRLDSPNVVNMIKVLKEKCQTFKIIGTY